MEHIITPIMLKRRASIIKNNLDQLSADLMREGTWTYDHSRQYIDDSNKLMAVVKLSPKTLALIYSGTKPEDWTMERTSAMLDNIEDKWDLA